ncbi:cell division protein FtsH (plasmid) [Morganella morganii]|uniref:Cell division protein FtsH n=1 Tax=Morganella morganii TaxID=582 RepID=A0A433ZQE2_MORMO|nr:YqjK-like family protein [Morganella morganii]RUT64345.1 cell division protein FtsH [Morganella morganii]
MNKHQRAERARKKQALIDTIAAQRSDLSQAADQWLKKTESFDRTWQTLSQLRPLVVAGVSLISVLSVRHPKKLIRWGQRALGLWGIFRTLQNNFPRNKQN